MTKELLRTEAVEALARLRGNMLSIVTMQAVDPWNACGQADARNFNVVGCMGSAAAVALGLALSHPEERVLVVDGDGSLLMQLASLVSIADQHVANLYHVVMENGTYETSGGQLVPGHQVSDLCTIALASGYQHAFRFTSAEEMAEHMPQRLRLNGPVFISLRITGPGALASPSGRAHVPNKATQIENMRLALATAERSS